MRKKIVIVILTWNRAKFLKICLEELLKNLFYKSDIQIIIMDNGSTDETDEVLKLYENKPEFKIIRNSKNLGLNAYKKLFSMAKGEYIIEIDDDVLEFPKHFDKTFVDYMITYKDYGFLSLNVIQDEFTNGAKPDKSAFKDDVRGDKVIQMGATGGWCGCFRIRDFNKIKFFFIFSDLGFELGEDGLIQKLFHKLLRLKGGVIKNAICLHASGPYYSKKFGYLEQDIEKYKKSKLPAFVDLYSSYRNKI